MKTRWFGGLPLMGVLVLALAAAPAAAAASGIWRVTPTPNPGAHTVSDVTFGGVSSTSPNDVWAVGINQDQNNVRHPLLEHFDGHTWKLVSAPEPTGVQSWFNGVDALSTTNVWAVGESANIQASNQDERTFIEHWNGRAWSIVASPNPAVGFIAADVLDGVAGVAGSDLWAVGWDLDPATNTIAMLFEHFDGKTWKVFASPTPVGAFQFAVSVNAIASHDVWAVGDDQSGAKGATLAAHWNGRSWTIIPTPSLFDGIAPQNFLTGVTAAGSRDVWASGYEDNVNNKNFAKPYLLHWDGKKWTLVLVPNAGGEGNRLFATTAVSANDVWAVGQTQQDDGSILTLTQRFNGSTWTTVPSPTPGRIGNLPSGSLDAVTNPRGGELFAVGTQEIPGQCCLRTLALQTSKS
jgi:hypothetical protein